MLRIRQNMLSIGFCIISLMAAGLHAENAPVGAQVPSAEKPQDVMNPDKPQKPNANPLNLNPAQQQALAALRNEQASNLQKIHALQRQLMELSYSDSYDKDKAEQLVDQIAKATRTDMTSHSKKAHDFYVSLSPEQKKQYKAFEQRRQKMLDQRMGGGRPAAVTPPPKPTQLPPPAPSTQNKP